MSITRQRVAVIGLGRFGTALARRLAQHGAEVIAVDRRSEYINEVKDEVAVAVRLDATDEQALRSQEVDRVDCCVIAIGEHFESALLATVICKKNLQIPNVICRAQTKFHAEIFAQIGADEVIQPEQNAGDMLGRRLAHPSIHDYITLGEGFTVIELAAPAAFVGKTVVDLRLRAEFDVNLIAIRRSAGIPADNDANGIASTRLISVPRPGDTIHAEDILVLAGEEDSLAKLPKE